ncbi:MAG: integrase arm-type DNA-binding domain-containing protein [Terracidiphilus sp.]
MLTAAEINGAKVRVEEGQARAYKMFDQGGLYLHVTETGSKLWRYQFRLNGKQSIASLGRYPVMSLAGARDAHRDAQKLVAEGINPTTERKASVEAEKATKVYSFASVAHEWLEWFRHGRSERHVAVTESRLNRVVLSALGGYAVNEMTAQTLVEFAKAVESETGREMADRCLMVVGQVLRWAVSNGKAKQNVHAGLRPSEILKPAKVVNFARLEEKELPGLLQAIEVYSGTPLARLGMKLMAYSLLRTSELISLRWSDVCDCGDAEAPKVTITGDRMKAGRDHVVPLSKQAVHTLRLLKQYREQIGSKSEYVFPGTQGAATMSNMTLLLMFKRMGYGKKMTGHGWRGVASTILNEHGFNRDWIEMALAHVPQGVRHDYNKALYLDGRREMLQWYADLLDTLAKQAPEAEVADH